jgi:hypothetical protein
MHVIVLHAHVLLTLSTLQQAALLSMPLSCQLAS